MGKHKGSTPLAAVLPAITLDDVTISATVSRSPWRVPERQDVDGNTLALVMTHPGGFETFWYELSGFVEILDDITDKDDADGRIVAVAAGIRALLAEVNPGRCDADAARQCSVVLRKGTEAVA
jgi:hypothetical protein